MRPEWNNRIPTCLAGERHCQPACHINRVPGRACLLFEPDAARRAGKMDLVNDRASPGRGGRSQAGERQAAGRVARRPGSPGRQRRNPAHHRQHFRRCRAVAAADRRDHRAPVRRFQRHRSASPRATSGARPSTSAPARNGSAPRSRRRNCGSEADNLPGTVVPRKPADPHSRPRQRRSRDRRLARTAARARRRHPHACRHAAAARGPGDRRSHRPSRPARTFHAPRNLRFSKVLPTRQ